MRHASPAKGLPKLAIEASAVSSGEPWRVIVFILHVTQPRERHLVGSLLSRWSDSRRSRSLRPLEYVLNTRTQYIRNAGKLRRTGVMENGLPDPRDPSAAARGLAHRLT